MGIKCKVFMYQRGVFTPYVRSTVLRIKGMCMYQGGVVLSKGTSW